VLSVEHVLQEITYKTVSQEAAAVENECWLTCAWGLIYFSTIWRVLIKSTLGSPIMKTLVACHSAMSFMGGFLARRIWLLLYLLTLPLMIT